MNEKVPIFNFADSLVTLVSNLILKNSVKGESKIVIGWNMNSTVNQDVLTVSLV